MLAQNFRTPAELHLEPAEFDALLKVLGMLERDEIPYTKRGECAVNPELVPAPVAFNMYHFAAKTECGTACCICGWAEHIGHLPFNSLAKKRLAHHDLDVLFDPAVDDNLPEGIIADIRPDQAAIALRNYLTFGAARWEEIVGTR